MNVIFIRAFRVLAPFYVAGAPIASYFAVGLTAPTWVLLAFAVVVLASWPLLREEWLARVERPALRRQAPHDAEMFAGVLYLRSFALDGPWAQLQDFVIGIIERHNASYADHRAAVAIGRDDSGAIAKVETTTEGWKERLRKLSDSVDAIVMVPVDPTGKDQSGVLYEIVHTMSGHAGKTIYVMPPLATWERYTAGTDLAGRLPALWADTMARLGKMAPRLALPAYDPAGCFWYLRGQPVRFPFTDEGAREALFKVLDEQRVVREIERAKYDPDGKFAAQRLRELRELRRRAFGGKPPPGIDDYLA
jgi:hypothetical protein